MTHAEDRAGPRGREGSASFGARTRDPAGSRRFSGRRPSWSGRLPSVHAGGGSSRGGRGCGAGSLTPLGTNSSSFARGRPKEEKICESSKKQALQSVPRFSPQHRAELAGPLSGVALSLQTPPPPRPGTGALRGRGSSRGSYSFLSPAGWVPPTSALVTRIVKRPAREWGRRAAVPWGFTSLPLG